MDVGVNATCSHGGGARNGKREDPFKSDHDGLYQSVYQGCVKDQTKQIHDGEIMILGDSEILPRYGMKARTSIPRAS